jgi:hypothetical protein
VQTGYDSDDGKPGKPRVRSMTGYGRAWLSAMEHSSKSRKRLLRVRSQGACTCAFVRVIVRVIVRVCACVCVRVCVQCEVGVGAFANGCFYLTNNSASPRLSGKWVNM